MQGLDQWHHQVLVRVARHVAEIIHRPSQNLGPYSVLWRVAKSFELGIENVDHILEQVVVVVDKLRVVFTGEDLDSNVADVVIIPSFKAHHFFVVGSVAQSQALLEVIALKHFKEEIEHHLLGVTIQELIRLQAEIHTGTRAQFLSFRMSQKHLFKLLFLLLVPLKEDPFATVLMGLIFDELRVVDDNLVEENVQHVDEDRTLFDPLL